MSEDKRLKSTEIIYNDRAPTEVVDENSKSQPSSDSFKDGLVSPQSPAPGGGRETKIYFGDSATQNADRQGNTNGPLNSAAAHVAAAALGLPPNLVEQAANLLMTNGTTEGLPGGYGTPRPVTGWLVVIKGPGRGKSVELSFGRNDVGRDPDQSVQLDFGDEQISRQGQFYVTFDPRSGKYLCSPGESTRNLCYLGGEPLVSPMVLNGPTDIEVGASVVRFVPLCDEAFTWSSDN